jgi:hypothetical protein
MKTILQNIADFLQIYFILLHLIFAYILPQRRVHLFKGEIEHGAERSLRGQPATP